MPDPTGWTPIEEPTGWTPVSEASAAPSVAPPPAQPTSLRDLIAAAKDVGVGFAKGAGRTVKAIADDLPHAFGGAGLSDYIDLATGRPKGTSYQMVSEGLQPKGTAQTIGGLAEAGVEMALPAKAGVAAIPTEAKAGQLFTAVEREAGNVPVDTRGIEDAIMKVKERINLGAGSMPTAVTKLINRLDEPIQNAGPLVYRESRELASNLSKLTVSDKLALNDYGKAAVANLAAEVAKANGAVAKTMGKGAEYVEAMNMWSRAKALQHAAEVAYKKVLPLGVAGTAAYYLYGKAKGALTGE